MLTCISSSASYEFVLPGPAIQRFEVKQATHASTYLVKILDNHGNPEETCVYRIQMLADNLDFETTRNLVTT